VELVAVVIAVVVAAAVAASAWNALVGRVTVYEYERGLRYDKGRFEGILEPGQYRFLRRRTRIDRIDVRPELVTVPGQEVVTADGVSIRVSVTAVYELADPVVAIVSQGGYREKLYTALQLALRTIVAEAEIDALLERRSALGERLTELARDDAARVGLRLVSAEVKDLMFPGELRRTFAQVVTARKGGQAALERARGETAALRNLANAARMMESNPALMQLRLLQELDRAGGNTVVLGLPGSSTPLPIREGRPPDVEGAAELPPSDE